MMHRLLTGLFLLAVFHFKPVCLKPQTAEPEEPGTFFFTQYWQEPWRVRSSVPALLRKSGELALVGGVTWSYLFWKKRKFL